MIYSDKISQTFKKQTYTIIFFFIFVFFLINYTSAYNCLWHNDCPGQKRPVNLCGDGICGGFENKENCYEDCASTIERLIYESNTDSSIEDSPFGVISQSFQKLNTNILIMLTIAIMLILLIISFYYRYIKR